DDALYTSLVENAVVPLTRAFRPQLLLVSAGYDAHREDPLADCHVTEAGGRAVAPPMGGGLWGVGGAVRGGVRGWVWSGGVGAVGRGHAGGAHAAASRLRRRVADASGAARRGDARAAPAVLGRARLDTAPGTSGRRVCRASDRGSTRSARRSGTIHRHVYPA